MTVTTIKVDTQTRDRLKAQAAAARVPLGVHLSRLADEADRRERFRALRRAFAATTPEQAAGYAEETNAWENTELSNADG